MTALRNELKLVLNVPVFNLGNESLKGEISTLALANRRSLAVCPNNPSIGMYTDCMNCFDCYSYDDTKKTTQGVTYRGGGISTLKRSSKKAGERKAQSVRKGNDHQTYTGKMPTDPPNTIWMYYRL